MISILFGPNRVLESQKTTLRTNKEIFNTHLNSDSTTVCQFFLRVFPPQQHSNKTPLHHTSLGDFGRKVAEGLGQKTEEWKETLNEFAPSDPKWLPQIHPTFTK